MVVNGNIMFEQQTKFEALSIDIHPNGTTVSVGGSVSVLNLELFHYHRDMYLGGLAKHENGASWIPW